MINVAVTDGWSEAKTRRCLLVEVPDRAYAVGLLYCSYIRACTFDHRKPDICSQLFLHLIRIDSGADAIATVIRRIGNYNKTFLFLSSRQGGPIDRSRVSNFELSCPLTCRSDKLQLQLHCTQLVHSRPAYMVESAYFAMLHFLQCVQLWDVFTTVHHLTTLHTFVILLVTPLLLCLPLALLSLISRLRSF